jgi:hypothetical protein
MVPLGSSDILQPPPPLERYSAPPLRSTHPRPTHRIRVQIYEYRQCVLTHALAQRIPSIPTFHFSHRDSPAITIFRRIRIRAGPAYSCPYNTPSMFVNNMRSSLLFQYVAPALLFTQEFQGTQRSRSQCRGFLNKAGTMSRNSRLVFWQLFEEGRRESLPPLASPYKGEECVSTWPQLLSDGFAHTKTGRTELTVRSQKRRKERGSISVVDGMMV